MSQLTIALVRLLCHGTYNSCRISPTCWQPYCRQSGPAVTTTDTGGPRDAPSPAPTAWPRSHDLRMLRLRTARLRPSVRAEGRGATQVPAQVADRLLRNHRFVVIATQPSTGLDHALKPAPPGPPPACRPASRSAARPGRPPAGSPPRGW